MGSAIFHFDEEQLESPQSFTDLLTQRNTQFKKEFLAGVNSLNLAREHSLFVDGLIKHFALASGVDFKNAAIFALGGYGREELGLHSDIDLLFLCENPDAPQIKKLTGKPDTANNKIHAKQSTILTEENRLLLYKAYLDVSASKARVKLGKNNRKITRALLISEVANYDFGIGDSQEVFEALMIYTRVFSSYLDSVYTFNVMVAELEKITDTINSQN